MRFTHPPYAANAPKRVFLLLLCVFLLAGCTASTQHKTHGRLEDFTDYLNQQINVMTYSQAVEAWGTPERVTHSIGFFVATWPGSARASRAASAGTSPPGLPVAPKQTLQLTFDKETDRMVQWKYQE
jgi:hypothetical protein